jgi:hypothetical protein
VATPASRDLPGETPAVSRVLSIHPQRAKARKGAAVRPPRGDPRPSNYQPNLPYFRRQWERLSHHPETQYEPFNLEWASFETHPSILRAVVLHEHGYWSGHETLLKHELGNRFGKKAYAAEELIAEPTAAFLCAHLGSRAASSCGLHRDVDRSFERRQSRRVHRGG